MSDILMWWDCETTGSDELKDCIIEVGCALTAADLSPLYSEDWDPYFSMTVKPTDEALGRMMRNSIVRDMHTDNGLLAEILAGDGLAPDRVAKLLLAWLIDHGAAQGKVVICGSGVAHFDRRFVRRYMPQLDRFCRYWMIDVGVIRRAHDFWLGVPGPNMNDGKTHRALDDAKCHLAEARAYQKLWQERGVGRTEPTSAGPDQVRSGDFYTPWHYDGHDWGFHNGDGAATPRPSGPPTPAWPVEH